MVNKNAKNTSFFAKRSLNLRGRLFEFERPLVMGIINLTDDSFFEQSRAGSPEQLLITANEMIQQGADIIDLGAMSTRPGAVEMDESVETKRIVYAVETLQEKIPEAILSVDTYRSQVAVKALQAGAHIINDISGGSFDKKMMSAIAGYFAPYIIMHTPAKPATMQQNTQYKSLISDINIKLAQQISRAREAGILDIIIDPGFGFGKTLEQNYQLLQHLEFFTLHKLPVMVGFSRKSMITKVLNIKPEQALTGTIALNTVALLKGASILRVHDVKDALEVIQLLDKLLCEP